MVEKPKKSSEWREFEKLVARIESALSGCGVTVTSPDQIRCRITGQFREVDASIRSSVGGVARLITIECRKRPKIQDVTWIEQLATKQSSIGADHTIAVSSSGFSASAKLVAQEFGILLKTLRSMSVADIHPLLQLDLVLFWRRCCALAQVGIKKFQSLERQLPHPDNIDFCLLSDTDPFDPIFQNLETGRRWSLNDLWHELQQCTDPFQQVEKAQPPIFRTVCFPYPGDVTVETSEGPVRLGDVLVTVALWIAADPVDLHSARKVEYASSDHPNIHRIEFASNADGNERRFVSLQIPKSSKAAESLHVEYAIHRADD